LCLEGRRRGDDHVVDVACDHLLERIETHELAIGGNVDTRGDRTFSLQGRKALAQSVWEGIAHGNQLDPLGRGQGLLGGAGAAAPAADEPHPDLVAAGGADRA
jgi:hypothetical protein